MLAQLKQLIRLPKLYLRLILIHWGLQSQEEILSSLEVRRALVKCRQQRFGYLLNTRVNIENTEYFPNSFGLTFSYQRKGERRCGLVRGGAHL